MYKNFVRGVVEWLLKTFGRRGRKSLLNNLLYRYAVPGRVFRRQNGSDFLYRPRPHRNIHVSRVRLRRVYDIPKYGIYVRTVSTCY